MLRSLSKLLPVPGSTAFDQRPLRALPKLAPKLLLYPAPDSATEPCCCCGCQPGALTARRRLKPRTRRPTACRVLIQILAVGRVSAERRRRVSPSGSLIWKIKGPRMLVGSSTYTRHSCMSGRNREGKDAMHGVGQCFVTAPPVCLRKLWWLYSTTPVQRLPIRECDTVNTNAVSLTVVSSRAPRHIPQAVVPGTHVYKDQATAHLQGQHAPVLAPHIPLTRVVLQQGACNNRHIHAQCDNRSVCCCFRLPVWCEGLLGEDRGALMPWRSTSCSML
jgi:hypothetical protein